MIRIGVSSNLDELISSIRNLREDQLPFAIAKAVTATAQLAKKRLVEEMPKVFDRPTPFTLNSLFLRPATKANPSATVWLKDDAGKGTPAAKYLLPEIVGGQRKLKRSEKALQATGLLPSGLQAVPASGAKFDAYGNMARGQIIQVLSALQSAETRSGFMANRTAASKKRKGKKLPEFFVGKPGGGKLPLGVWQSFKGTRTIKPILLFTTPGQYKTRYHFEAIAQQVVAQEFEGQFYAAYAQAVATAR